MISIEQTTETGNIHTTNHSMRSHSNSRKKQDKDSSGNKVSILLVIPLREEFERLTEVFSLKWRQKLIGTELYYFAQKGSIKIAAITLLEMGNQPALDQTRNAIEVVDPEVVICVGIGGSLKDDLKLGDVAVSRVIAEIVDAAKVSTPQTATKKGNAKKSKNTSTSEANAPGYDLELMQRQFESSIKLLKIINSISTAHPSLYRNWQNQCKTRTEKALAAKNDGLGHQQEKAWKAKRDKKILELSRTRPQFQSCHFASGLVVASSELRLRTHNREFKVVETEGAGVARACLHREYPIPFIVLRGISDFADQNKSLLESPKKLGYWPEGAWRTIAAENVARFVQMLLDSPDIIRMISQPEILPVPDIRRKAKELAEKGSIRFREKDTFEILPIMAAVLAEAATAQDLYISAGDLWIARPLLTHRDGNLNEWFSVKDVYVITIDPSYAKILQSKNMLPRGYFNSLVPNMKAVNRKLEELSELPGGKSRRLYHTFWKKLPPFHGYVFGDYAWHGHWSVGNNGQFAMNLSDITFVRRDAFPAEYNSVRGMLPYKRCFRLANDTYIAKLEREYGQLE